MQNCKMQHVGVEYCFQCSGYPCEKYNHIDDFDSFIMPPATSAEVYGEIGEPKAELEKIKEYKEVIFWSFSRKDYKKTNWWPKTASAAISTKLTIRTANTVRRIVEM